MLWPLLHHVAFPSGAGKLVDAVGAELVFDDTIGPIQHQIRKLGCEISNTQPPLFFITNVRVSDSCGDVMKLQIRVDDKGIISDVKFKTFGCGSAIASSSYMTERVKGLSLDEAGRIKNTEIAKELALPPVKLHCSSE